ncbi:MAG: 50S ribosomal protein L25 [Gemmatimonadota bacterium]|jgi:large subunit ribosomal protein L25|nr:50S ribosomal protein L25 [Gemmatimonadota bacterium]
MAQQALLEASKRTNTGKGAARAIRRDGKVPGVIYGHNREPEAVVVDAVALGRTLQGASSSTVLDVAIDGGAPVKALVREIQRDPVRPADIIHLDLYEVSADETVIVDVPVHLTGIPDGVRNFGGVLDLVLHSLELEVLPGDIPERLELDVTHLGIGESLHVSDVSVPKATILNDPELAICSVVAPRIEEAAAPVAEEPGATSEPELIRKPRGEDTEEQG